MGIVGQGRRAPIPCAGCRCAGGHSSHPRDALAVCSWGMAGRGAGGTWGASGIGHVGLELLHCTRVASGSQSHESAKVGAPHAHEHARVPLWSPLSRAAAVIRGPLARRISAVSARDISHGQAVTRERPSNR